MESESVKDEHAEYQLFCRHIDRIRAHPQWRDAQIIFIPENNTGMGGHHLQSLVRGFTNVHTYWEKDRPGVLKTHQSTDEMQKMMVSCLFHRKLRFDNDLFTQSHHTNVDKVHAMAREQMERFHWEKRSANSESWSMTAKGSNQQDDLIITLLMAYKYGLNILTNTQNPVFANISTSIIKRVAQTESLHDANLQ